ncbi:MAG: hypothetical protein ABH873_04085 [Candidatus Firestonebacteria bacterium]
MLRKLIVLIFVYMIFISPVSFAAHPLTTDDIGTVEIGKYELEIGYDNCKSEDTDRNHSCGLSLKHGLTEKMDIGISFPIQVEPKYAEQLGKASLGLKFLLIKDILAFSISNELGSKEYFINSIVSTEISPVTLHFNFGYKATGDESVRGEIIYSSAFECPIEKIDLVGEIIGEQIGVQNWLLGIRYKIVETIFVDCAYGNGFRKADEKISFGFHTEF